MREPDVGAAVPGEVVQEALDWHTGSWLDIDQGEVVAAQVVQRESAITGASDEAASSRSKRSLGVQFRTAPSPTRGSDYDRFSARAEWK